MAKLPIKKLSLADCVAAIVRMEPLYCNTEGPAKNRFKLDKEAEANFKLTTVVDGEVSSVTLEGVSPAADHLIAQAIAQAGLRDALQHNVEATKLITEKVMNQVLDGYNSFADKGGAHAKFHKHECVPFLLGATLDKNILRILLEYPQSPAKREAWFEKNEKKLDEVFKEPMGLRTERLVNRMVHWVFCEQLGEKYDPAKFNAAVTRAANAQAAKAKPKAKAVPAPAPKPEVEALPGDNQFASAFKKAKLFIPSVAA